MEDCMLCHVSFLAITVITCASLVSAECAGIDYLELPIPVAVDDHERAAITLAYPDSSFSPDGSLISFGDGPWFDFGERREVPAPERLNNATVIDQFHDVYPLDFDLDARDTPYFDPGRARNNEFFLALYGDNEMSVREMLVRVTSDRFLASFNVTKKRNVACQLSAVIETLEKSDGDYIPIFSDVGGGFIWRTISGSNRLSPHSFGIAIDLNAALGKYWRWTGSAEGSVGTYNNRIPPEVVRAFERYGFIWGGKWHHFDGMHFEFRPELIIHARLVDGDPEQSPLKEN